jgi:glutamate racemase
MSDARPIGMFDSGIGGLTVAKEVFACMPARCPYGGRSEETIRAFGLQNARFLMSKDIKMLIVACNTVSSVALDHIQKEVNEIPVIGVVAPGARAAVSRTVAKRIGIIGTIATIRTGAYEREISRLDPGIKTYGKACPLFVPLVEEGLVDGDIARLVVQRYVYELINYGVDCLVLGCTHYPLLLEALQSAVGAGIQLLDSAYWTAREAKDILTAMNIRSAERGGGMHRSNFFVTDITEDFPKNASAFLGNPLPNIEKVKVDQLTETVF